MHAALYADTFACGKSAWLSWLRRRTNANLLQGVSWVPYEQRRGPPPPLTMPPCERPPLNWDASMGDSQRPGDLDLRARDNGPPWHEPAALMPPPGRPQLREGGSEVEAGELLPEVVRPMGAHSHGRSTGGPSMDPQRGAVRAASLASYLAADHSEPPHPYPPPPLARSTSHPERGSCGAAPEVSDTAAASHPRGEESVSGGTTAANAPAAGALEATLDSRALHLAMGSTPRFGAGPDDEGMLHARPPQGQDRGFESDMLISLRLGVRDPDLAAVGVLATPGSMNSIGAGPAPASDDPPKRKRLGWGQGLARLKSTDKRMSDEGGSLADLAAPADVQPHSPLATPLPAAIAPVPLPPPPPIPHAIRTVPPHALPPPPRLAQQLSGQHSASMSNSGAGPEASVSAPAPSEERQRSTGAGPMPFPPFSVVANLSPAIPPPPPLLVLDAAPASQPRTEAELAPTSEAMESNTPSKAHGAPEGIPLMLPESPVSPKATRAEPCDPSPCATAPLPPQSLLQALPESAHLQPVSLPDASSVVRSASKESILSGIEKADAEIGALEAHMTMLHAQATAHVQRLALLECQVVDLEAPLPPLAAPSESSSGDAAPASMPSQLGAQLNDTNSAAPAAAVSSPTSRQAPSKAPTPAIKPSTSLDRQRPAENVIRQNGRVPEEPDAGKLYVNFLVENRRKARDAEAMLLQLLPSNKIVDSKTATSMSHAPQACATCLLQHSSKRQCAWHFIELQAHHLFMLVCGSGFAMSYVR